MNNPILKLLAGAAIAAAFVLPAAAGLSEANIRNAAYLTNVAKLCNSKSAKAMARRYAELVPTSDRHLIKGEAAEQRKQLGKDWWGICLDFEKHEADFRYGLDSGANDPIENPPVPSHVIRKAENNCKDMTAGLGDHPSRRKLYNNCIEGELGAYRYKVRNGLIE